jgi:hypothetical protein
VKQLLAAACNVDLQKNYGGTALYAAARPLPFFLLLAVTSTFKRTTEVRRTSLRPNKGMQLAVTLIFRK